MYTVHCLIKGIIFLYTVYCLLLRELYFCTQSTLFFTGVVFLYTVYSLFYGSCFFVHSLPSFIKGIVFLYSLLSFLRELYFCTQSTAILTGFDLRLIFRFLRLCVLLQLFKLVRSHIYPLQCVLWISPSLLFSSNVAVIALSTVFQCFLKFSLLGTNMPLNFLFSSTFNLVSSLWEEKCCSPVAQH